MDKRQHAVEGCTERSEVRRQKTVGMYRHACGQETGDSGKVQTGVLTVDRRQKTVGMYRHVFGQETGALRKAHIGLSTVDIRDSLTDFCT